MKQSVEKQIKNAFESWENEENIIGFDKAAVWSSMQTPKKNKIIYLTWIRAAAIIIFLFLLSGWGYSYRKIQCLQISQSELRIELDQAKASKNPVAQKEIETKIIYKTQIKTVESKQAKTALANLAKKLGSITAENTALQQQLNEEQIANNSLQDSINSLKNNLDDTNKWYALQLKKIESQNQTIGLSIDINEEALMALSKNNSKTKSPTNNPNRKFKITFKNNSRESETSAPLFKDLTMK